MTVVLTLTGALFSPEPSRVLPHVYLISRWKLTAPRVAPVDMKPGPGRYRSKAELRAPAGTDTVSGRHNLPGDKPWTPDWILCD